MKSGWAAAVLLTGPPASPRMADSRRIDLSDPAIPESRQPYHAGFGTARESDAGLKHLVSSVRRFGRRSVSSLIRTYATVGHPLTGVGLVVGSMIDPDRIANAHIRIHALEGRLFREVVQQTALKSGVPCSVWRERDLYAAAAEALRQPEQYVRSTVAALGRNVRGSWRAEQKAAALAAWLVLAARKRPNDRRRVSVRRDGRRGAAPERRPRRSTMDG